MGCIILFFVVLVCCLATDSAHWRRWVSQSGHLQSGMGHQQDRADSRVQGTTDRWSWQV